MSEKIIYRTKLISKAIVARDVLEFRLDKPTGFSYVAGQFIQFHIPQGDSFVLRSYSLACAPGNAHMDFLLKVLAEGKASQFFERLEPGGEVGFEGPQGQFVCEPGSSAHKYFIATGTGLAPIMALIEDEAQKKNQTLSLLFGVHAQPDLIWIDKLQALAAEHNNFSYQLTLSHPEITSAWPGLTGRVTPHLPNVDPAADYYVCGNLEMIKDVRLALTGQGVPAKNIHLEIF